MLLFVMNVDSREESMRSRHIFWGHGTVAVPLSELIVHQSFIQ
jgi:hypothetical protein